MQRRSFLSLFVAWGVERLVCGRRAQAAPPDPGYFWVHVQAEGGWDQTLLCDPKPNLRPGLPASERIVRHAGNLSYLSLCDFGLPEGQGFFGRYHDRLLVINGIDTGTNNHEIGARYSSSGSTNERTPCFAAQVAAVYGQTQPLAFLDYGGYDETADLIAPTRVQLGGTAVLRALIEPNSDGAEQFLRPATAALVEEAHRRRTERLLTTLRLPGQQQALRQLLVARAAQRDLARLPVPSGPDDLGKLIRLGLDAYQQRLAVSMNLCIRGFDSHAANEATQRDRLRALLSAVTLLVEEAERRSVPAVVLMTSDFGRTPYYTNDGTDHWPVSSAMVLVTRPARARGLRLPTGRTIGGTTDGGVAQALRPLRVHPRTLALDSGGVVITPGHLMRALRRAAGIAEAEALRRFPLTVDQDLALG
ncbi:MAG: DUF1501 domain-containing protein [Myxococcales bacterium]|nr:DUF1501 domain-containing protein [Myxococcales bacterium]